MASYIFRRVFQAIVVMLVASFAAFLMFSYVGDPVVNMVGQEATLERRAQIAEDLGLNDPIYVQYVRFLSNAVQGDFGLSYRTKIPVSEMIATRSPRPWNSSSSRLSSRS